MTHPMHDSVVALAQKAIQLMDDFLRDRINIDEYAAQLQLLDVEEILEKYSEEFKCSAELVHYLDALMLLSSLKQELDFQVAEYGANVALEDMRNLQELISNFEKSQSRNG